MAVISSIAPVEHRTFAFTCGLKTLSHKFCTIYVFAPSRQQQSLNILNLLAHLFDQYFQFHRCLGGGDIRRL